MDSQKIEKAARDYALDQLGIVGLPGRAEAMKAFIAGAHWRVNSVWHDASEMPEKGRPLLEFCRGTRCGEFYEIGGRISIKKQEWDDFYKFAGIVYWAYIDELIPERKEETK